MLYFKGYLGDEAYDELAEGVRYWCDHVLGTSVWNASATLAENIEVINTNLKDILKRISRTIITINNLCYLNRIPTMISQNEVDIVPFSGEGAMYTGFVQYAPPQTASSSSNYEAWATLYLPKKYTTSAHTAQEILDFNEAIWYLVKTNNEIIASISSLKMLV